MDPTDIKHFPCSDCFRASLKSTLAGSEPDAIVVYLVARRRRFSGCANSLIGERQVGLRCDEASDYVVRRPPEQVHLSAGRAPYGGFCVRHAIAIVGRPCLVAGSIAGRGKNALDVGIPEPGIRAPYQCGNTGYQRGGK